MDAKQARKLLDDVCADLDRRRTEMSALLGRYARPVGLGLALGLSGVAGCGSDSGGVDAPSAQDAYGATADLYVPRPDAAYGVAIPDAAIDVSDVRPSSPDLYGVAVDVADLRPPAVDIYAAADLPRGDIDAGEVDKPKPDAGASVDSEPVDGGAID